MLEMNHAGKLIYTKQEQEANKKERKEMSDRI